MTDNITLVVRGIAKDYQVFVDLATQMHADVTGREPGTIRYECYGDPATSQFVWHEIFADNESALQHLRNLMATEMPQRVAEVVRWEGMLALGAISDEVLGILHGISAEFELELELLTPAIR